MAWLIIFGILLLMSVLPLGVRVSYDAGGVLVKIVAGPVRVTVYPLSQKKKKETKKQKNRAQTVTMQPKQSREKNLPKPPVPPVQKNKDQGGSLLDFLPLVKMALDLLGDFRRKLRINELYLRLILASSDPCDLAVNYGRAWSAVGNLMPQLERLFVLEKRDVEVQCDFTASETKVIARMELTITLGRLLSLAAVYGLRAVKEYLTIQKKRKGGAVT